MVAQQCTSVSPRARLATFAHAHIAKQRMRIRVQSCAQATTTAQPGHNHLRATFAHAHNAKLRMRICAQSGPILARSGSDGGQSLQGRAFFGTFAAFATFELWICCRLRDVDLQYSTDDALQKERRIIS